MLDSRGNEYCAFRSWYPYTCVCPVVITACLLAFSVCAPCTCGSPRPKPDPDEIGLSSDEGDDAAAEGAAAAAAAAGSSAPMVVADPSEIDLDE